MENDLENPAVLVVEDETFTRIDAVDLLSDAGVPSYEAADAEEALSTLQDHPDIRVLFTDVNMPGRMDGMALARNVSELRPDLAIIVTSGKRRIPEAELPCEGTFLPKPYKPQQLIAAVAEKLRRFH